MTYPTPATFTALSFPTAADLNSLGDAANWLATRQGQTVNLVDSWASILTRTHNGTWTYAESAGNFTAGATTSNTTPIVIPAGLGGVYAVSLAFNMGAVATGTSWAQLTFGGLPLSQQSSYRNSYETGESSTSVTAILSLAAGSTIGIISSANQTGAKNLAATLTCYLFSV